MKKVITILISSIFFTFAAVAQNGFVIEYIGGGSLYSIDLTNAQKTLVGNTMNNFGAGDFGPGEIFYAINSGTNELYEIDTITGATTFIASIQPPLNHTWTGMAYDKDNDIMYGYSAYAVASGEGSLHIIDVTDGTYTLVGTQTTATAIGCIAIDGEGQIYGMNLSAIAKIYKIDSDDGTATVVGPTGQSAAGMGHGMDYSYSDQTMYLTTYNSINFANTLRTVDLNTGLTTQVGDYLGNWTSVIAIPEYTAPLSANFTADVTDICAGEVVNYTDMSVSATSWSWIFEGGIPSTSTQQNPTVTYNSAGVFDVTLEVSDGTSTDTDFENNMITVTDVPTQPITPIGESEVCAGTTSDYQVNAMPNVDEYIWILSPDYAGEVVGSGENISVVWESDYYELAYLSVYGSNTCGDGAISDALEITVDDCTNIDEVLVDAMEIYPNPAKNFITVSFSSNNEFNFKTTIFNQYGQLVYERNSFHNNGEELSKVNIKNLSRGIYIIKVSTDTKTIYQSKFEVVE